MRVLTEEEAREELGGDGLRTAARHALWRRGDLRYLLHPGQKEALRRINHAWETDVVRFVVNVGRRWGKSFLMVVICAIIITCRSLLRDGKITLKQVREMYDPWLVHAISRSMEKARIVYAAPTGDMITDFIVPHFDLLESHAPPELLIYEKAGDYTNRFGDHVRLKGCEDRRRANRLRGPKADLAIADEGGFVPILGYVVKSALGFQLTETEGMCLLPSTPPESPDHPYVDFVREAMEGSAYYHATTYDAPHLTDRMLRRMEANTGGVGTVAHEREMLAKIVRDPQLVVLPEFVLDLVSEAERPAYFLPAIIGDVGWRDMTVVLFGYYDFIGDRYVIEREVAGQHVVSDVLQSAIWETAVDLWGPELAENARRRIDGTARERAELSRQDAVASFAAVSRDGKSVDGRMRTLANQARIICREQRLVIDPSCATTIAHMQFARWDASRRGFERVKDEHGNVKHHYDGCAAALYFLRDVDDTTNPYPALPPGVSEHSHWLAGHERGTVDRKRRLEERFTKK